MRMMCCTSQLASTPYCHYWSRPCIQRCPIISRFPLGHLPTVQLVRHMCTSSILSTNPQPTFRSKQPTSRKELSSTSAYAMRWQVSLRAASDETVASMTPKKRLKSLVLSSVHHAGGVEDERSVCSQKYRGEWPKLNHVYEKEMADIWTEMEELHDAIKG